MNDLRGARLPSNLMAVFARMWLLPLLGVAAATVRIFTVASCTQRALEGFTAESQCGAGFWKEMLGVFHARSTPALAPQFAAYNTALVAAILREIRIVRRYFTQELAVQAAFDRFRTLRRPKTRAWSDELAASEKFLAANKKTLEQLNKKWETKRDSYVAGLERQNASTLEARAFVQLLDHDLKEHFGRFRQREVDQVEQQRELERSRSYNRVGE